MRFIIGTVFLVLTAPFWIPIWAFGYIWRVTGEAWVRWGGRL